MLRPDADAGFDTWAAWLLEHEDSLLSGVAADENEARWWIAELQHRTSALTTILREYMPWLLPEFAPLRNVPQIGLREETMFPSLETAADFAAQLDGRLARAWATREDESNVFLGEQLRTMLPRAKELLQGMKRSLRAISEEAYRLADEMDFAFLLQKGRMLLSIGYEMESKKLHAACYDLLASEARIAAFVAIAKGDISATGVVQAGTHTHDGLRTVGADLLDRHDVRVPHAVAVDAKLSRTRWFHARWPPTVQIQRAFAREHRIPWGISECGYAQKDDKGHYHYQAFGIPQIALKWDATAGPVVSPYSTLLALGVDSAEALRNLKRMADTDA